MNSTHYSTSLAIAPIIRPIFPRCPHSPTILSENAATGKARLSRPGCGRKSCPVCRLVWEAFERGRLLSTLEPKVALWAAQGLSRAEWRAAQRIRRRHSKSAWKATHADGIAAISDGPIGPKFKRVNLRSLEGTADWLIKGSTPRTHLRGLGKWRRASGRSERRPEPDWRVVWRSCKVNLDMAVGVLRKMGCEVNECSDGFEWTPPDWERRVFIYRHLLMEGRNKTGPRPVSRHGLPPPVQLLAAWRAA